MDRFCPSVGSDGSGGDGRGTPPCAVLAGGVVYVLCPLGAPHPWPVPGIPTPRSLTGQAALPKKKLEGFEFFRSIGR